MDQKRKTIEKGLLILVDIACLVVSLTVAFHIRYGIFVGISGSGDQLWLLSIMIFLTVFIGTVFDFYHHFFRRGVFQELSAVVKTQIVFSVLWILTLYLLHRANALSRLVFTYFIVINTVLTYICHLLLKQYMIKIYRKKVGS